MSPAAGYFRKNMVKINLNHHKNTTNLRRRSLPHTRYPIRRGVQLQVDSGHERVPYDSWCLYRTRTEGSRDFPCRTDISPPARFHIFSQLKVTNFAFSWFKTVADNYYLHFLETTTDLSVGVLRGVSRQAYLCELLGLDQVQVPGNQCGSGHGGGGNCAPAGTWGEIPLYPSQHLREVRPRNYN